MAIQKKQFFRLAPVLLLIFIDSFSYFVVIPILLKLFYQAKYGLLPTSLLPFWRDILIGIAIPISTLAALIAAPWMGNASDKYGRKKTILISIVIVSLGFLLQYVSIIFKSLALIFLGRIITGIGSASQPIAQAAVADIFGSDEKNKSTFLMLNATMMTLALIFAPLVGGYLSDPHLVSWFSITTPYLFALGLSIINLILMLVFFKETLNISTPVIHKLTEVITQLPRLMKRYRFGKLLFIFLCFELGWSQYYQSISLILNRYFHFTTEKVSLFNTATGVEMAVGLLISYPIFLRFFSVNTIVRFSALLTMIGLTLCALFPTTSVQWAMMPIVAIFTGTLYIGTITLISDRVAPTMQGLTMGYISTTLYLAWMITAAMSGALFAIHPLLPLYVAAAFLMAAAVLSTTTITRKEESQHGSFIESYSESGNV